MVAVDKTRLGGSACSRDRCRAEMIQSNKYYLNLVTHI